MKDEARIIARALASVPAGAQMLVIDAESRDGSVAIAHAFGARTIVRPWAGFVETRRFALAEVRTPWTFMLDADEALDERLALALARLEPARDTDGYTMRRLTYFCGRPICHGAWGRDAPLRLFRTERASLRAHPAAGGSADLHERWSVPGRTQALAGSLVHHSYPTFETYRAKFAHYTALEARGSRRSRSRLARAAVLAPLRVAWALVGRGGWRDGWRGVLVALGSATYPVAVAWKALRR